MGGRECIVRSLVQILCVDRHQPNTIYEENTASAPTALQADPVHGADLRQPISLESQLLSEGPGGLGGEKGRSLLDMVGQGGSEHRISSSLRSSSRSTAASTRITPAVSLDLVMAPRCCCLAASATLMTEESLPRLVVAKALGKC